MGRPGRSVRVGILAGVVAWHALVVLLLLRQQVVLPRHPEFVTTWLRIEPEPPRETMPEAPAPPTLLSPSLAPPPLPPPPALEPPAAAITQSPEVDWYGEAARAARDQYARRLPTPRVLEEKPKEKESPAPAAKPHRKGDQEDTGNGEWKVWLNARCWMIVSNAGSPPPGQIRPAVIGCLRNGSPIDAAILERRRPDYLLEPPLAIPRKRSGAGQTRPGPSMGGTPRP